MSVHTPGPWSVLRSLHGYPYQIQAQNEDNTKPGVVGKNITRWAAISLPSSAEGQANARLIAAAPDLLAALIVADRTFAENGLLACHAARHEIKTAIAKAEGEQA